MDKVLITGGTGLVGTHLQNGLKEKGYQVVVLTRTPKHSNEFKWNVKESYIDEKAFTDVSYIIHLAGEGIATKRWSTSRKKELIDSRVKSAELLFNTVKRLKINLKKFISSSGIGFYGMKTREHIFKEEDQASGDFISEICVLWENATQAFEKLNIPITILRTSIVLTPKKGALSKINTPLFLSVLGSGKQYMPWIHINDLVGLYILAIENSSFNGVFNAVAPEHITNKEFTKIIGKTIGKPVFPIHIPDFVLKLMLGAMAGIIVEGSRVSSEKLTAYYKFKHPVFSDAIKDLLA